MEANDHLISTIADSGLTLSDSAKIWDERDKGLWQRNPDLYLAFAKRLKNRSRPFWLYEITSEGLESEALAQEQFAELTQIAALSLARTGATAKAEELLLALLEKGHEDVETLAILGRINKDLALRSPQKEKRDHFLREAVDFYEKASRIDPDSFYALINLATLERLLGNQSRARELAENILTSFEDLPAAATDYWLTASLGEASLILGETDKAVSLYRAAVSMAGEDHFSVASMRKQALLILKAGDQPDDALAGVFKNPGIAIFSGHRVDAPGREPERFPSSSVSAVSGSIQAWITEHHPDIAYASAAPGADLLFCEAAIAQQVELSIVLPFELSQFREYVAETSDESWVEKFDSVISKAREVVELSHGEFDEATQGPSIYDFTNQFVLGSARSDAEFLGGTVMTLAVWDGDANTASGGTADCISMWRSAGQSVDGIIDPKSGAEVPPATVTSWPDRSDPVELPQEIRAVLFADVVGFSSLTDSELLQFFKEFLGQIAVAVEKTGIKPLTRNNWGDAYYLVFETASDACTFALAFQEAAFTTNWIPEKRTEPLVFRTALNAGPIFRVHEPVCDLINYVGQATNLTARIEPVVAEGQIFASEYFAALVMVEQPEGISLDYVGKKQLPKKYGTSRVFALRRSVAI